VLLQDMNDDRIVESNPGGAFIQALQYWGAAYPTNSPNAVAVSPVTGNVFVLTGSFVLLMYLPSKDEYIGVNYDGDDLITTGLAVDSSGNLYVCSWTSVLVYDAALLNPPTSSMQPSYTLFGDPQFKQAIAVAVDSSDRLYVLDQETLCITTFSAGNANRLPTSQICPTALSTQVATPVGGYGECLPSGIAIDAVGRMLVVCSGYNYVVVLTPTNGYLYSVLQPGLNVPEGIAINSTGFIYIADSANNRVVVVPPLLGDAVISSSSSPKAAVVRHSSSSSSVAHKSSSSCPASSSPHVSSSARHSSSVSSSPRSVSSSAAAHHSSSSSSAARHSSSSSAQHRSSSSSSSAARHVSSSSSSVKASKKKHAVSSSSSPTAPHRVSSSSYHSITSSSSSKKKK
jgi:hypothetical protein